MSLTVEARPFEFISDFLNMVNSIKDESKQAIRNFNIVNQNIQQIIENNKYNMTEEVQEEILNIICKEYETNFVNQDVLTKTLEEHGFDNIEINDENITCEKDFFKVDFIREEGLLENGEKKPYRMKITTECTEAEIAELLNNINDEYTSNSQEENYIKIKERLEKNGLEINEEEVFDDDTIVLTVNLD